MPRASLSVRIIDELLEMSAHAQQALPHGTAEIPREDHKVEDDDRKKDEGRGALEAETILGGVAGEVGDRITGDQ